MERLFHQMKQECPLRIYFCLQEDKKVQGLCWWSVVGQLGFYHKITTYGNGSADLVAAKFGVQPNYTVNFIEKAVQSCICKS